MKLDKELVFVLAVDAAVWVAVFAMSDGTTAHRIILANLAAIVINLCGTAFNLTRIHRLKSRAAVSQERQDDR